MIDLSQLNGFAGHFGHLGGAPRTGALNALGGFREAMQDYRANRPVFDPATMTRPEYRGLIRDYRSQRPSRFGMLNALHPGHGEQPGLPNPAQQGQSYQLPGYQISG